MFLAWVLGSVLSRIELLDAFHVRYERWTGALLIIGIYNRFY